MPMQTTVEVISRLTIQTDAEKEPEKVVTHALAFSDSACTYCQYRLEFFKTLEFPWPCRPSWFARHFFWTPNGLWALYLVHEFYRLPSPAPFGQQFASIERRNFPVQNSNSTGGCWFRLFVRNEEPWPNKILYILGSIKKVCF